MESTAKLKRQGIRKQKVVCKKGMNRGAVQKRIRNGNKQKARPEKWFAHNPLGRHFRKKRWFFKLQKCGRSKQKKDAKRKYPKCVPLAKARSYDRGQRRMNCQKKKSISTRCWW